MPETTVAGLNDAIADVQLSIAHCELITKRLDSAAETLSRLAQEDPSLHGQIMRIRAARERVDLASTWLGRTNEVVTCR